MEIFVVFFFSFFLSEYYYVAANITKCEKASCGLGPTSGSPLVQFPFRLKNQQQIRCGYRTGFDLSCNNRSQTVIKLRTRDFTVQRINYEDQSLWINDPNDCLPRRFLNQEFDWANTSASTSPFAFDRIERYTFLRCSPEMATKYGNEPISCLRTGNDHVVLAVPTSFYSDLPPSPSPSPSSESPSPCSVMAIAKVPVTLRPFPWPDRFSDLSGDIRLKWIEPDCSECLARGGECGFQTGSSSKIGCSVYSTGSNLGLPRSAKYGIIIGVGIPGLLCILGLASYVCGRVRACGQRRRPNRDYAGSGAPEPVVVVMGLDGPTIETFPKIELGESKRLPNPNDNTCPICLSEYQPKDTLRTIPECNHYFHSSCVDEWLKMNATCPLCRNSPEGSSTVTPSSSASSSSSLLSSSSS